MTVFDRLGLAWIIVFSCVLVCGLIVAFVVVVTRGVDLGLRPCSPSLRQVPWSVAAIIGWVLLAALATCVDVICGGRSWGH